MRAVNVLLAVLVSVLLVLAVLEGGLRLLGLGPQPTIHRFDRDLGWVKEPGAVARRSTGEFDVTYRINALGLRDDPMEVPAKPQGTMRVLFLGDSFVLGYTVEREDLFVDVLETWWRAEGRSVDCVNAGTEGWSTDQEVLWFQRYGRDYSADVVVLCPYENDLYWNASPTYLRFPKPRFEADGTLERRTLHDPGPEPAARRWALSRLFTGQAPPRVEIADGARVLGEQAAYFRDPPPVIDEALARTRGALQALRESVEGRGARLFVAPIPNKACIDPAARAALEDALIGRGWIQRLRRALRGTPEPAALAAERWSPDEPVERVLGLCRDLGIETLDARDALRAAAADGTALYFERDWHFDPAGNRAFARFLHDELDRRGAFPPAFAATATAPLPEPPARGGVPTFVWVFLALWAAVATLYRLTWPGDGLGRAVLVTGSILALVFTVAVGGSRLVGALPATWRAPVLVVFVIAVLTFVLAKLGKRLGTIAELLLAFTRRGHWYLMPLVVVLLTVGSLLVVAASSPLVAPFIYTLF